MGDFEQETVKKINDLEDRLERLETQDAGVSGPHNLLDGSVHPDTAADTVTKGSLVAGNATPKWDELEVGSNNQMLTANSAESLGMKWGWPSFLTASDGAPDPALSADASGYLSAAVQPLFLASETLGPANVTGDGTTYSVVFNNEIHDRSASYVPGTGIFTAPVTSNAYSFTFQVHMAPLLAGHAYGNAQLSTTARNYYTEFIDPYTMSFNNGQLVTLQGAFNGVTMTVGQTARIDIFVGGSTKTIGLYAAGNIVSYFAGFVAF